MAGSGLKVFVSGACGFIGSHLCEALRDAAHNVTGMAWTQCQGRYGWLDEVEDVKKVNCDVLHEADLRGHLRDQDVIFHLAALIDVAESYERPEAYLQTNLFGTANVLKAARATDAQVILASSSEIYGTAQYTPMDEAHPLRAQSPYAASKIAADALAEAYRRSYKMRVTTLRPFNTYGPRQSNKAVIGRLMEQRGAEAIELGNLEARRDFTYVTDTAAAFVAAMKAPRGIYNCGTGRATKIGDVVRLVLPNTKITVNPERVRPRDSEVWELRCAYDKFYEATKWRAKVSFEEGLELTRAWHDRAL